MTYLDRLAARLDAAGIAYERDHRTIWVFDNEDVQRVDFDEHGHCWPQGTGPFGLGSDWTVVSAIVVASEVWREMQEGGE